MKSLQIVRNNSEIAAPIEAYRHFPEDDSYNVAESLQTVKQAILSHLFLIFCCIALTMFLVIAYMKLWPPVFQADVVIASDAEDDRQRSEFYQQWNVFRKDALVDESLFMVSGPILERVMNELDLSYAEVYHPFMRYAIHLWGESSLGKAYRKIKYKFFPLASSEYSPSEEEIERHKILKNFRDSVTVVQVGEANVGLLIVKASTQRVAEIANKVIEVYLEERRNRFVDEASRAYSSLAKETESARNRLTDAELALRNFYTENSLVLAFEKDRAQLGQWMQLRSEIVDTEARRVKSRQILETITRQLEEEGVQVQGIQVLQEDVQSLRNRLVDLELELDDARRRFQPTAPEIVDLEQKIAAIRRLMGENSIALGQQQTKATNVTYESLRAQKVQLVSELAGLTASLASKRKAAAEMERILEQLPAKVQMNHGLDRDLRLREAEFTALNEKLTMAAISMATAKSAPSTMRVIEQATPPDRPIWPNNKLLLAAAMLVGAFCGVIAALLLDLIYVKINRQKLDRREDYVIYGVVVQDPYFVKRIYSAPSHFKSFQRTNFIKRLNL